MNVIWNPEYETMDRDELRTTCSYERLQMTLRWAYNNVPFYRARWDARRLSSRTTSRPWTTWKIAPFTVKADFRKAYPYELFAVPLEQVVRIHSSTGTTSRPSWWATPGATSTPGPRSVPGCR